MSSRVERMFGPRENWGKGDEMAAVRERAVRQEGGGQGRDTRPRVSGHRRSGVPTEKVAPSVSKTDSSPMLAHRGAKGNGTQAVPYGVNGAKDNPSVGKADSSPKRGAKKPPQSLRDSSPIPAGQGSRGAKEAKKAGFNRGGGAWGGLAGFVSIRCECGKVVNTCLHQRTPVFKCKDCGGETSLAHVANIHMKCGRCGFTGKYRTNRTEDKIQMECLQCSDIVYLTKIRWGNYVVEGEE